MTRELELWTTTQVAKYLDVKPGTVSAYRHRGQMPAPVTMLGERTHLGRREHPCLAIASRLERGFGG